MTRTILPTRTSRAARLCPPYAALRSGGRSVHPFVPAQVSRRDARPPSARKIPWRPIKS